MVRIRAEVLVKTSKEKDWVWHKTPHNPQQRYCPSMMKMDGTSGNRIILKTEMGHRQTQLIILMFL